MNHAHKNLLKRRLRRALVQCAVICIGGLLLSTTARASVGSLPETAKRCPYPLGPCVGRSG